MNWNRQELIANIEKIKPTAIKLGFDYPLEANLDEAYTYDLHEFHQELMKFILRAVRKTRKS